MLQKGGQCPLTALAAVQLHQLKATSKYSCQPLQRTMGCPTRTASQTWDSSCPGSSSLGVLQLLQQLDHLLLGPEDDSNDIFENTDSRLGPSHAVCEQQQGPCQSVQPTGQQQLLQQILQNASEDPVSAATAFDPNKGHPNAYQLLLSSMQDGHLEAAQILLLLQLLLEDCSIQHQQVDSSQSTHSTASAAGTDGSSSGSSNNTGSSVLWPGFVFRRLADMALTPPQSPVGNARSTAVASLPVVALRLLATAAAAAAAASSHRPDHIPAVLTTAVQQIMTAAAAAMKSSPSSPAAATLPDTAAVTPSPWLINLGLPGLITLSDLITSWAGPAAVGDPSGTTAAVRLQLVLLQCIQHPSTAAAATNGTAASNSNISSRGRGHVTCSNAEVIRKQLDLLLQAEATEVLHAQGPAATTGVKSAAAAAGSSGSSRGPPMGACCAAANAIISNITVLIIRSEDHTRAANKDLIKDIASFVRSVISSSPKKASQQYNWSGKPTGYTLKQTAAETCRCSSRLATTAAAVNSSSAACLGFSPWSSRNRVCYDQRLETLLLPAAFSPSSSSTAASSSLGLSDSSHHPHTFLEAALLLLLAVVNCGGRTAAAELYRHDVSSMLERLREFSSPRVLDLTEKLYGCLCLLSSQIKDEIMQDGNILALTGVINCTTGHLTVAAAAAAAAAAGEERYVSSISSVERLLLAALGRLSAAIDGAGGLDILRFTGAWGSSTFTLLPAAAAVRHKKQASAIQSTAANCNSSSSNGDAVSTLLDSVQVVLSNCSCGLAAVLLLLVGAQRNADGVEQGNSKYRIRVAAAQVFVAALNRCRSMQHLQQGQTPKGGLWSRLAATSIRQIEMLALNPATSSSSSSSNSSSLAASDQSCTKPSCDKSITAAADSTVSSTSSRSSTVTVADKPTSGGTRRSGCAAVTVVEETMYDEDGLRVVWSSGPSAAAVAARTSWKQYSLHDLLSWTQSSTDLDVRLLLPQGTKKRDVIVSLQPDRLTVRLSWYGRVIDGPLAGRITSSETCWILDTTTVKMKRSTAASSHAGGGAEGKVGGAAAFEEEFAELQLLLPKENGGHFWRALFEGGVEKSHLEVLQEAVSNEDDARCSPSVDQLGPEAALLYEELRERQELMVSGQWDIENSFDDFRLVIGDNTL